MDEPPAQPQEYLDVLTKTGQNTRVRKLRGDVHRDGDYHRAVHVWIYSESTNELLLQKRADCKDSWPGQWDISSAGHISAGDSSLITARRELQEELGVNLPEDAFELLFVFLQECIINDGNYINNEYNDVYLVTTIAPIPLEAFSLQESEVSAVKYISCDEYKSLLAKDDPDYVPYDVNGQYGELFNYIAQRYKENVEERSLALQRQLNRYAPIPLSAELGGISDSDKEALVLVLKAAMIMDDIFHQQVCASNPALRDWLKEHADTSPLNKLKWKYFGINKSPWSCLDENQAFLSTADSAIIMHSHATKLVSGWKGLEYKAAFPLAKSPGANFYPSDMDKLEFELWKNSLSEDERQEAMGFFNVIKRHSGVTDTPSDGGNADQSIHDLYCVPFSQEYWSYLTKASELLYKAAELTSFSNLKKLLYSKADAFLSNDYYDSDIAWMELDSKLDVTIGPYETYEDALFGYKATFEAFIGVRDDDATAKLKLFGDNLLVLEQNLPMKDTFKSKDVTAAPIRVIQLLYNAGKKRFKMLVLLQDVKGPQTVAFNLPNDERIVKDRGTSMVMLKNVSEAKFKHILFPIAEGCISKEQQELVDFDSFFTHTICHECCHGIGPHSIVLPDGRKSTVRLELQELHSALEEAKADIVGLWALNFFISQNLLPSSLCKSMYVSFLAGCFRSVRFGLDEAHGKGQALQFNWLFEKEAFILHPDGRFSVDFDKILTIQATGDKIAASSLLEKYCKITNPLRLALDKLESAEVPVDITPTFTTANQLLHGRP
uniref:Nudix hydrolase domain-containing protein n=1 Tax=Chenopodium quinoa TaxID=63459 RepID=A0A803KUE1_CHEQI